MSRFTHQQRLRLCLICQSDCTRSPSTFNSHLNASVRVIADFHFCERRVPAATAPKRLFLVVSFSTNPVNGVSSTPSLRVSSASSQPSSVKDLSSCFPAERQNVQALGGKDVITLEASDGGQVNVLVLKVSKASWLRAF
jgi:hypothetical protein